jgi:chemotaxis protein CheD
MSKEINIKTGELAIDSGNTIIKTGSIGSCIVVAIYDNVSIVGGLAHSMLPMRKEGSLNHSNIIDFDIGNASAKYADEAVDNLIYGLKKIGGKIENMSAKLVGGASMFRKLSGDNNGIGHQNTESARNKLNKLGIRIDNEDTGGSSGKSVVFNIQTGLVEVVTTL